MHSSRAAWSPSACSSRRSRSSGGDDPRPARAGQRRRVVAGTRSRRRLFTPKIWGIGCVVGEHALRRRVEHAAPRTALRVGSTALGLAFALIVTRTGFRYKKALRVLSVLPIITPPFVIGLGLILIFGRSGLVNQLLEWAFGIEPTRWIYGLQGVLVAQVFAFTPIAFLVLIGVVEGVSPSLEEAAQTLRADRWRTFADISLPLMRPGLANAFLISFIESIADFGNPIVLGGNFGVLSTEVFFSVVGAQLDQGRAATLGILLLRSRSAHSSLQRRVLGAQGLHRRCPARATPGLPTPLPDGARRAVLRASRCRGRCSRSCIYAMALAGGFVETWGRDYTLTLRHYVKAFGIEWGPHGMLWAGAAWNSFWTTVQAVGDRRAAHRRARHPRRLPADAAAIRRPVGVRVRHDAVVRHSRHGDRRVVHPRLQRAADRDHRHRADPRRLQRLPQHAGRRARGHGVDERRSTAASTRRRPRSARAASRRCAVSAAAAQAGRRRRAGLQLRARDDHGVGRHLPRLRRNTSGRRRTSSTASSTATTASRSRTARC